MRCSVFMVYFFLAGCMTLLTSSCSNKMAEKISGRFVNKSCGHISAITLDTNGTFSEVYHSLDIATPEMNVGRFIITGDSIILMKDKDYFFQKNVRSVPGSNSETLRIGVYAPIDQWLDNEWWLTMVNLKIHAFYDGETTKILSKSIILDTTSIIIDSIDARSMTRLEIYEEAADVRYDIDKPDQYQSLMIPSFHIWAEDNVVQRTAFKVKVTR